MANRRVTKGWSGGAIISRFSGGAGAFISCVVPTCALRMARQSGQGWSPSNVISMAVESGAVWAYFTTMPVHATTCNSGRCILAQHAMAITTSMDTKILTPQRTGYHRPAEKQTTAEVGGDEFAANDPLFLLRSLCMRTSGPASGPYKRSIITSSSVR